MAKVTAMPLIGARVTFDNKTFDIYEGDKITDLVYADGPVQKTLTGVVRVLNVSSRAYSTGPDECPPESFIKDIVAVNELIIDTSDQYDAELVTVAIKNIVSIATVNDKSPQAVPVDPSMEMMFVYNAETWEAAKAAGATDALNPEYEGNIETCPLVVLKINRGTKIPMKLSSFAITAKNEKVTVTINSSTNPFKSGSFNMDKETYFAVFELITPKDGADQKDYLNRTEVKPGTMFTAYAVANDELTIDVSSTYTGAAVK